MKPLFLNLSLLLLFSLPGKAQDSTSNNLKIAGIPVINYNRTQGICLGALVSGYYKLNMNDSLSPSSSTGVFGMFTSQKSFAIAAFQQLYLAEDKWRIRAAIGHADVDFQFYYEDPFLALGGFVDYTTKADFAALQIQRKIYKRIYVGLTGAYIFSKTTFDLPAELGGDTTSISNLNDMGYIITNDSRDNVNYPSSGSFLNFRNQFYASWTGSDYTFTRYLINYNKFFRLSGDKSKIIAARANCSIATGDVPFEGQTVVGQDDIRGYSQGEYRNDQVYTLQTEYRWNFYKKFGMVGFLGIASAVKNISDIFNSEILPGIGVGFRYRMISSEKINIGLDFGVGQNDYSITFRLGESFGR